MPSESTSLSLMLQEKGVHTMCDLCTSATQCKCLLDNEAQAVREGRALEWIVSLRAS